MAHSERAIVFLAWGKKYIDEVENCIHGSILPDYDRILITDQVSEVQSDQLKVIRAQFRTEGLLRKTELLELLPFGYKSYLFLDSDTKVIADIELGFLKAEQFGIAISPAPHYSLEYFWGFEKIMAAEGVSRSGQLQYNTGVIFFSINELTREVFRLWQKLAGRYRNEFNNDQPFFTLAMEMLHFNPYTLSIGYNYRNLGDQISGRVRVWHSHAEMPENINAIAEAWPPRRVVNSEVIYPGSRPQTNPDKAADITKRSIYASKKQGSIWLASYPRSGNTLLRTILFHCFGLRSASIYESDLRGKKDLEELVGHLEYGPDGKITFPPGILPLIKTHEYPGDEKPAIYVVRDGRNVCMSMYHFYKKEVSLEKIICGKQKFGTWSAHLVAWHPWDRPNTLLLKYEDLVANLERTLQEIGSFLQKDIVAHKIPPREKIAEVDGRWVRGKEASRELPEEYHGLFGLVNGEMMRKFGYFS